MKHDCDNLPYIDSILERFYNGTSTIDEEKILASYFASDNIPDKYKTDKEVFLAIAESSRCNGNIPDTFGANLDKFIDHLELQEKISRKRKTWRAIAGIAANLAIAIGIGWHFIFRPSPHPNEITDSEIAYFETAKALTLISEKLNRANDGITCANSTISNINNDINTLLK